MSRPTCAIDEERLWDLLDDPASTDDAAAALRAHVDACPRCAERLAELRRLHSGLTTLCRADPPPLPERIGPYRVVRRLGEGGMGTVYEAEQREPARRVAVKVVHPGGAAQQRQVRRFEREIQALAKLRHPGLVVIHDAGRDAGQLYLVMELVEGEPIDRHCARTAADLRRRLELCAEIAEAVEHAHERGVIHLDLKPGNVLVDATGQPRVVDFGLARFLRPDGHAAQSQSMPTAPSGTVPYMSPEQLSGTAALDGRSDVFALGVILFQLLTGRLPYGVHRTAAEAARALARATGPAWKDSQVPPPVRAIVTQAVAADPAARYGSAHALAADLRRYLGGDAVAARPAGALRMLLRRLRHGRLGWATAAAVVGLLALPAMLRLGTKPSIARRTPLDAGSGIAAVIARADPRDFDFARDGEHAAYTVDGRLHLWSRATPTSRPFAGGGGADDLAGWFCSAPRWSPDGRRIAVVATPKGGGRRELLLVDVAQERVERVLTSVGDGHRVWDHCWSSDGREITFVGRDLCSFAIDDGAIRRLGANSGITRLGSWSPDDRWLAYTADRRPGGVGSDVWLLPRAGGGARRLTCALDDTRQPTWGPDDHTLWFVASTAGNPENAGNVFCVDVDPRSGDAIGEPVQVTFGVDENIVAPKLVADGKLIYAVCRSTPTIHTATGAPLEPGHALTRGGRPRLSRDGDAVYFVGRSLGRRGLFAVPRSGGEPRLLDAQAYGGILAEPFGSLHDPAPDGAHVAYPARPDGPEERWQLRVVPTAGGRPRVVAATSAPVWVRWSPDGRWLAWTDGGGLHVASYDGGEPPRLLAALDAWDGMVEWSPGGDLLAGLGYATKADSDAKVNAAFVVAFPSGEVRRATPASEDRYKEGLVWHPSGGFLTYLDYGVGDDSEVRFARVDGGPTERALQLPDHWDWVGRWTPDGDRFFFLSFPREPGGDSGHVFDLRTGAVAHTAVVPVDWSAHGDAAVWTRTERSQWIEVLTLAR